MPIPGLSPDVQQIVSMAAKQKVDGNVKAAVMEDLESAREVQGTRMNFAKERTQTTKEWTRAG